MGREPPRLLLSDSSVLFRFFAAGAEVVEAFMSALGDRLHIVFDVKVEIDRHKDDSEFRRGARRFLELLENEPIVLPDDVRERVRRTLELTRRLGLRDEDIGETATVLYARSRIRAGEDWLVLVAHQAGARQSDRAARRSRRARATLGDEAKPVMGGHGTARSAGRSRERAPRLVPDQAIHSGF